MLPFALICLLVGVGGVPYLAITSPAERKAWWACVGAAWLGLFLTTLHVSPGLAELVLLGGPVALLPYLLLWGIVGRRRRVREACQTRSLRSS